MGLFTKHIILNTSLNREDIYEILQKNIETFDLHKFQWRIPKTEKAFLGVLSFNDFYIMRNIKYKNSWKPFLSGQIYDKANHCKLSITFRIHKVVLVFTYLWLTPMLLLTFYCIYRSIYNWEDILGAIIPLCMVIFMLTLSLLSFRYETKKAIALLSFELNAQEEVKS